MYKGIVFIVLILEVTSSPTLPSPRVTPCAKTPFLYIKFIDKPSILSSVIYSTDSPERPFFTRTLNARSSSALNALARLSIGFVNLTLSKASDAFPPTRCVGESDVIISGYAASKSTNSL